MTYQLGSGSAKLAILVLALLTLEVLEAVVATDYAVGDSDGWTFAPPTDQAYYDNWATKHTFYPGDNLVFNYGVGQHDVQVVSADEYAGCLMSSGTMYTSGMDIVPLPKAGHHYFLCNFVSHCDQGMKMNVTVKAAATPSATPPVVSAPPPPPIPVANSPPPVASPPRLAPATPPEAYVSPAAVASKSQAGLIAGVCGAVFGAAALIGLFLFCFLKRRRNKHKPGSDKGATHQQSTSSLSDETNSRPYTFKELSSMTKNFNDSELLSSGAFGDVYKGTPPLGGSLLAVKRIKHENEHGQETFLAEANSLRQIRHRNLLQLRGWCEAKEGMFLVYDFMSNGSLDKWLHPKLSTNPNQVTVLPWNVRFSILSGVASGLEYLHEGWVQCVLHRDIKSSNVMLDANFNAYLGDFGLARLVDHHKLQKTTMPAGTLGYMAPEMHYTGRATKETDVYAFGILVLEVVCGRRPFMSTPEAEAIDPGDFLLLDRVWRAHEAGNILEMVDPGLTVEASSHGLLMASVLQWGLLCCLSSPSERPSMRLVSHWFKSATVGAMEPPALPATKPAPHSRHSSTFPTAPPWSESTSSSQSTSDTTRSSIHDTLR